MKSKQLASQNENTFVLIFNEGDEVTSGLLAFAKAQGLRAAHFSAIGAFSDVTLGYFNWQTKAYDKIPVNEQVEVLSLIGDIALKGQEPKIHAHVVIGKRNGTTRGGHLLEAHVRPTLEVILSESPSYLKRTFDEESGLALINLEA